MASLLDEVVAAGLEAAVVDALSVLVVEAVVDAVFDLVNVALLKVVLRWITVPVAALRLPPRPMVPIMAVPAGAVVVATVVALERDATIDERVLFTEATADDRTAGLVWETEELEDEDGEEVVATAALPPVRVNSPV